MFRWHIEFCIEAAHWSIIHAANGGCKVLVEVKGYPIVDMGPSASMEVSYRDIVSDGNRIVMIWHPDVLGREYRWDAGMWSQVVWVKFPDSEVFQCLERRSNGTFQSYGFLKVPRGLRIEVSIHVRGRDSVCHTCAWQMKCRIRGLWCCCRFRAERIRRHGVQS